MSGGVAVKKRTARWVETVKKPGKYGDGDGLQFVVSASGAKQWVLRFTWRGKAREMGLGSYPEVDLAKARERALQGRQMARNGVDPIAAKKKSAGIPTFGEFADGITDTLLAKSKNAKHRAQWAMTLQVYAEPLRSIPVDRITTDDVVAALRPVWEKTPETASRLRGRIERVLNAAKAKGFRSGENPAAWHGHLENLLPGRHTLDRGHHAAMAYDDAPAFMRSLREREGTAARALEFIVLTAARSGEALGARWAEFDLDAQLWTVPAERMKARHEHRVPLSEPAIAILREQSKVRASDFVFPGVRKGRPISAAAIKSCIGDRAATVHGFRSAFRDWAGNETAHPREIAEHALAHKLGDKTEQAYRRSDALAKRRRLMNDWAAHCGRADNVVTFRRPGS
jgi:integrase